MKVNNDTHKFVTTKLFMKVKTPCCKTWMMFFLRFVRIWCQVEDVSSSTAWPQWVLESLVELGMLLWRLRGRGWGGGLSRTMRNVNSAMRLFWQENLVHHWRLRARTRRLRERNALYKGGFAQRGSRRSPRMNRTNPVRVFFFFMVTELWNVAHKKQTAFLHFLLAWHDKSGSGFAGVYEVSRNHSWTETTSMHRSASRNVVPPDSRSK